MPDQTDIKVGRVALIEWWGDLWLFEYISNFLKWTYYFKQKEKNKQYIIWELSVYFNQVQKQLHFIWMQKIERNVKHKSGFS